MHLPRVLLQVPKIKKCLYEVKGFKGASGSISITNDGSSKVQAAMFEIEKGAFKKVG